jgi:hypothetical protein
MNIFSAWKELWFGCWSECGERYTNCPSIQSFIDPEWKYESIELLIQYLNSAPIIATTSHLSIPWAIGEGDYRECVSYRSDGKWLWLDDLDYYIIHHHVRLPDNLIIHIEENKYTPPEQVTENLDDLHWPPVT